MTTASLAHAAPARRPRYGSMSRDRRWALRWSYFFLTLFAIFFLMPPIYMLITSLKTSAEISAATNPWWVYHPTLSNYIELLTSNQYLTFFRNSAVVSVLVVTITMLISVPAAFRAVADAVLGLGHARHRRLPHLPRSGNAVVHSAVQDVRHLQRMDRHPADQSLVGAADLYPTLTVPFCTWIMIGYFASIPKELDEAALMDGANYRRS
jgi:multiple sugar transport system permease protein